MAFDTNTRNKLAAMVAEARSLLRKEFTEQLQETYGIQPSGQMAPLEKLTALDDEQLDYSQDPQRAGEIPGHRGKQGKEPLGHGGGPHDPGAVFYPAQPFCCPSHV